jgi:hypothetical protein
MFSNLDEYLLNYGTFVSGGHLEFLYQQINSKANRANRARGEHEFMFSSCFRLIELIDYYRMETQFLVTNRKIRFANRKI